MCPVLSNPRRRKFGLVSLLPCVPGLESASGGPLFKHELQPIRQRKEVGNSAGMDRIQLIFIAYNFLSHWSIHFISVEGAQYTATDDERSAGTHERSLGGVARGRVAERELRIV